MSLSNLGKKYNFWGWESANVTSVTDEYKGIQTPLDLYDALSDLWCEYTCAPRLRQGWSKENKTLGQCSVTAFLAQDIFGGKVYGILRPGGNYHCYNVVGDVSFDLTSEQFGDEILDYENNPEQLREVHFAKEEKRLRYEYLKKKLKNYCKSNHLILDFSHVYLDEKIPKKNKVHLLDCSDIEECDLYCSARAEKEIWNRIKTYGIHGIHYLDSGNYHYVTGIITKHIKQDFSLVVFDHHTDMQKPMIEDMVSCGDWAGKTLDTNDCLQQLILIGPNECDIDQIVCERKEKLLTFSAEELQGGENQKKISQIKKNLPIYISIDKDVLDKKYSETNWNQGNMSLSMLEYLLSHFIENGRIIGIDICGECQQGIPLPEYFEAEEINSETNRALFEFLTKSRILSH